MEIVQMLLVVGSSIGAVLVLFSYTTALNDWTLPQMLVLLGVYYLVQGVEEMVFQPSVTQLMEHVRQGTLDFTLLKPANSQFLLESSPVERRSDSPDRSWGRASSATESV